MRHFSTKIDFRIQYHNIILLLYIIVPIEDFPSYPPSDRRSPRPVYRRPRLCRLESAVSRYCI